jgi:hypothetical protein
MFVLAWRGNGVSVAEGFTSVTEIGSFSCSSSMRMESVIAFKACFEAEYMACRGIARSEVSLPTFTIAPPRRCGRRAPRGRGAAGVLLQA